MDVHFHNRGSFAQVVTHIAMYREPASKPFADFSRECLRQCGLRDHSFEIWNVPQFSTFMSELVPLDVYGGKVLADESKIRSMNIKHGVLRTSLLMAASRTAQGGRQRYEYATMNGSWFGAAIAGGAFLSAARAKSRWMRARAILPPLFAFGVFGATFIALRIALKTLGLGLFFAQRAQNNALRTLNCKDCLDDYALFLDTEIVAVQKATFQFPPGMPQPPAAVLEELAKLRKSQCDLFGIARFEARGLQKSVGEKYCDVHVALRGDVNCCPGSILVSSQDREAAQQRITQIM